jgi:hypothetical protein
MTRSRSETITGIPFSRSCAFSCKLGQPRARIASTNHMTLHLLKYCSINGILSSVIGRILGSGTHLLGLTSTW